MTQEQYEKNVNHPAHYTRGKIEVCDFIEDYELDFLAGNAVKYICRAGYKGDAIEDLEKAAWYLDRRHFNRTYLTGGALDYRLPMIWVRDFTKDQQLSPPLAEAINSIVLHEFDIARSYVEEEIRYLKNEEKCVEMGEKES